MSAAELVSHKTALSSIFLASRQIFCQVLGAGTGIILARAATPAEFGVYAICGFLYYFLLAAGDLGLGASLIRSSDLPSEPSLRLMFTVRQIIDSAVLVFVWIAAPAIAEAYQLADADALLFRLLAVASFTSSFALVPCLMLERELQFGKIAIIETVQTFAMCAAALLCFLNGAGLVSFPLAWIAYSLSGALLANYFHAWRPRWRFDAAELRLRLPFSVPFQGIGLLTLLRDGVTPLLVGVLLGSAQVGYLNWALMLAGFAVLPVNALQRVYLPAFSRVRADLKELKQLVEQAVFSSHALSAPLAVLILVLAEPIAAVVFGEKWLSALYLFYPLWIANILAPTVAPLVSLLNALGQSREALKFTACYCAALWIVSLILIPEAGPIGFPAAVLAAQSCLLLLRKMAQRNLDFNAARAALAPWLCAGAMGLAVYSAQGVYHVQTFSGLLIFGAGGVLIYAVLIGLTLRLSAAKNFSPMQLKATSP